MTFRNLTIGARFKFTGDDRAEARILPELRITYRTKVSDWHYENHHADGDISEGRVGVGDQPVTAINEPDYCTACGAPVGVSGCRCDLED